MMCFYFNTKIPFHFNTQTHFHFNAKTPLQPNDYRYKLAANTTTPVSSTSHLEDKQLTIPLDQCLCFLHFRKQVGITNNSSCVSDFTTSLIQPRDDSHDRSLGDISQLDDFSEWLLISSRILIIEMETYHSPSPLVHNLDQSDFIFLLELIVGDRIPILLPLNLIRDPVDNFETLLEFGCDVGLRFGLFDEDED
jgi:hypothetical protein